MSISKRQQIIECAKANPTWTSTKVAEHVGVGSGYASTEMSLARTRGDLPRPLLKMGPAPRIGVTGVPPALNGASHVVAQLRAVRDEYAAKIAKIDQAIAALS